MSKKKTTQIDNLSIEKKLWNDNFEIIAGIDEAGRGCSAGPVVAACAIMPKGFIIEGLTDSKSIKKSKLKYYEGEVKKHCVAYGIGEVSPQVIDHINILEATKLAMKYAVENLMKSSPAIPIDYLLIDGKSIVIDLDIPQHTVIDGDVLSHSISAASILAKVYRDELMVELDKKTNYLYNWSSNCGYQTKDHLEALKKYGPTDYHRLSYKTIKNLTPQPTLFDSEE